ncbi:MAG: flavin-dependent oxidoreductase, partial [Pseudomonadota bacterium]
DLLDARCGGVFDDIETVLPEAERQAFLAEYKSAAGFAVQALNAAPPIIREGATIA